MICLAVDFFAINEKKCVEPNGTQRLYTANSVRSGFQGTKHVSHNGPLLEAAPNQKLCDYTDDIQNAKGAKEDLASEHAAK